MMFRTRELTIAAAALGLFAIAAPARAQSGRWLGDRAPYHDVNNGQSYYDGNRAAYDNGFRKGLDRGGDAARHARPFDLARENDYRNADNGYDRRYGDKDRYRQAFRSGFAEGYRQAYGGGPSYRGYAGDRRARPVPRYDNRGPDWNRYPYGGSRGYGEIAFQNGARDGYQKGRDDARHHRSPDPRRQKWYRAGDRDYHDTYGSRRAYEDRYRIGFQEGYRRAYGEFWRR